jgi:hypothetical protein
MPRSGMRGAIPPLPQYVFVASCPVKKKHKDKFTFTFTWISACNLLWLCWVLRLETVGRLVKGSMQVEGIGGCITRRTSDFLRFSRRWCIKSRSFWVVTPCSVVVLYQSFRYPFCLHFQGEIKRWYPTPTPHGVTTQETPTSVNCIVGNDIIFEIEIIRIVLGTGILIVRIAML